MKSIAVAAVLLAASTAAFAQEAAPIVAPSDPVLSIKLTQSQWNVVVSGLGKMPLETALPLVTEMQKQAVAQLQPQVTAAPTASAAKPKVKP